MSSLNLNNGSGSNGFGRNISLIPSAALLSPQSNPFGVREESEISNIPFKTLNLQPQEENMVSRVEGYFGNDLSLKIGEEVEANNSSFGSEKNGPTKIYRGHWNPDEDAKLIELVAQFGPQKWNNIAEHVEGRTGKSCRLRWRNQLQPRIKRRAFTEEEENKLLEAQKTFGNRWAMISRLFPGRTDNALKNQWHIIMARRQREQLYRKRKSTFQNPTKGLNMPLSINNAASESTTMSITKSTCTDLSLTTMPFHNQITVFQKNQASVSQIGLNIEKEMPTGEVSLDVTHEYSTMDGHVRRLMNVEQSNHAESENFIAQSVTKASIVGESNVSFIDFLGVGAT